MPANVDSSEFTHATQLFADKTAANAWRTSQTVFDASTSTPGDAEVKVALTALAEKINFLTYRLEQAGIMANS